MLKNILTKAVLTLGLTASLAASVASAQQTPPPAQEDGARGEQHERMGRWGKHHGRDGHGMMGRRALSKLNLTDAQKQQIKSIEERFKQSSGAKREEMRRLMEQRRDGATLTPEQQSRAEALRTELRESMQRLHQEMLAVLTPEQRTQLDQLKQEHKARREQRRERRMERRNDNQ